MTEYDEYVDFIIFGDGITSDVLSLVLKNAGKQFYVLGDDKVDQSAESPRSLALSPSSMNLLEFFGINFPVEKLNKMKVYESDLSNDKIKSELIFDNGKTLSYVTKYYDLKKSLLQETKAHKRKIESKNFSSIELDKNYNLTNTIVSKKANIIKKKWQLEDVKKLKPLFILNSISHI